MTPLLRLLITGSALITVPGAFAYPAFVSILPNGDVNRCANCHIDPSGGGDRNSFGLAFFDNNLSWDSELASFDSDEDGHTNGEELQDPEGTYTQGSLSPGQEMLVSAPGFPQSTPGERGIAISEVTVLPEGNQRIELTNRLWFDIDVADMILYTGEEPFVIPNVNSAETTVSAAQTVTIWVNSPLASAESLFNESVSGGIATLEATDFVALHWMADLEGFFGLPQTLVDHVQWGPGNQPREQTAAQADQWARGTSLPSPLSGESLLWDGIGEGVEAWGVTSTPEIGEPPADLLTRAIVEAVLAIRPSSEIYDVNMDGAIDAPDVVTQVNQN